LYEKLYEKEVGPPDSTGSSANGQSARGPSTWDTATELPRVLLEMTSLTYSWPLLNTSPRGDGHSVLVLPGFTAGDQSTLVLRRLLERRNYRALPWLLGQNTGSFELQDRLMTRFQAVLAEAEGKVSLIGQSLGGVFARVLARQWPDRVRQVITLGSPFGSSGPETVNSLVSRLFQTVSGMSSEEMRDQMLDLRAESLPVPTTAIYSRTDGVVHWSTCIDRPGAQSENIEVLGSHSGMAFNPMVLNALLDRLAQRDGQWQPFKRDTLCRSLMYPNPASDK